MKKVLSSAALLMLLQLANSCQITESFQGSIQSVDSGGTSNISPSSLLAGVYGSMRSPFQGAGQVFALSEVTTDERLMPTRAGDWDDNGKWRQLHLHNWDANHVEIRDAFNNLNGVVYAATDMLQYKPNTQQEAEARFLRAFAMYWVLDLFDQVPYRDPGEAVTEISRVRKGTEALDYIISEVNAVIADLPDAPVSSATKDAARCLLMKCYLNRGVYANRQSPSFAADDMNKVIALADQVIGSGRYKFAANYFDNFAPDNTNIGTENIFTGLNEGGISSGPMHDHWRFVSHYNMVPSGYNGPTALPDFYDKFGVNDLRRGGVYTYKNGPANPGKRQNVGFLLGQQYNLLTDAPVTDRAGAPLAFTREVHIIETDAKTLERTGIRPIKYAPDFINNASGLEDNDWVHFRLPDIMLMKAEAILHGGTATGGDTPLSLVNAIRTHSSRNAGALASVDLNALYDERGRELYLEMWRRQDMIRFGKFLGPIQEGPTSSDPKYLIFPIPNQQLAVNPNLTQNPGY